MMVERYPNLKKEVGGLISGLEISSLFDIKILSSGPLPLVFWHWLINLLSQKQVVGGITCWMFKASANH